MINFFLETTSFILMDYHQNLRVCLFSFLYSILRLKLSQIMSQIKTVLLRTAFMFSALIACLSP